MIDRLVKEVDKDTINKYEQQILGIVQIGESRQSWQYLNSIKRKAKDLDINIVLLDIDEHYLDTLAETKSLIDRFYERVTKIIILKPYKSNFIEREIYESLKWYMQDKDIERDYQVPTIKAIARVVDEIGEQQNILILNRSEDIGKPLSHKLIDVDHTVQIAHSKSKIVHQDKDLIISATNKRVSKNLYYDFYGTVIDVSNDFKDIALKGDKNYIGHIGLLTTSYLFNELVKE